MLGPEVQCGVPHVVAQLSNCRRLRIVGGCRAQPHSWPWAVQLLLRYDKNSNFTHECGGAILNSRFVITASHCFLRYEIYIRFIGMGRNRFSRWLLILWYGWFHLFFFMTKRFTIYFIKLLSMRLITIKNTNRRHVYILHQFVILGFYKIDYFVFISLLATTCEHKRCVRTR